MSGRFEAVDVHPSGVRFLISQDSIALIDTRLPATYGATLPLALVRTLQAGQVLSFAIDADGNYGNDSTGLVLTVTRQ